MNERIDHKLLLSCDSLREMESAERQRQPKLYDITRTDIISLLESGPNRAYLSLLYLASVDAGLCLVWPTTVTDCNVFSNINDGNINDGNINDGNINDGNINNDIVESNDDFRYLCRNIKYTPLHSIISLILRTCVELGKSYPLDNFLCEWCYSSKKEKTFLPPKANYSLSPDSFRYLNYQASAYGRPEIVPYSEFNAKTHFVWDCTVRGELLNDLTNVRDYIWCIPPQIFEVYHYKQCGHIRIKVSATFYTNIVAFLSSVWRQFKVPKDILIIIIEWYLRAIKNIIRSGF